MAGSDTNIGPNLDSSISNQESYSNTEYSILDILPWECMHHIFSYVPTTCLIKSEAVCKQWRDLVNGCLQHRYRIFDMTKWPTHMTNLQLQQFLMRFGAGITRLRILFNRDHIKTSANSVYGSLCPDLEEFEVGFEDMEYYSLLVGCKKLKSLLFFNCLNIDNLTTNLIVQDSSIEYLTVIDCPDFTGQFLTIGTSLVAKNLDFYKCSGLDSANLKNLYKLPHLTTLRIDHAEYNVWKDIPDIICRLTQLTELSLSNYWSTPEQMDFGQQFTMDYDTRFCQALAKLTELQHLNLSQNELVTNNVIKQIAYSCNKLETLDVSGCDGVRKINGVIAEGVSAVCASCKCLEVVKVSWLTSPSRVGLAAATGLQSLIAAGLPNLKVASITACLLAYPTLTELDVCDCYDVVTSVTSEVVAAAVAAVERHLRLLALLISTPDDAQHPPKHRLLTVFYDTWDIQ